MIKVGVVGATGYTGEELVRLLVQHPKVNITALTAKIEKPTKFYDIFKYFSGKIDLVCKDLNIKEVIRLCDLVFLALPHRVSMQVVPEIHKAGKKIIETL